MSTRTRKWVSARIDIYMYIPPFSFLRLEAGFYLFFVFFFFDSVSILLAYSRGSSYLLEIPVSYTGGLSGQQVLIRGGQEASREAFFSLRQE